MCLSEEEEENLLQCVSVLRVCSCCFMCVSCCTKGFIVFYIHIVIIVLIIGFGFFVCVCVWDGCREI